MFVQGGTSVPEIGRRNPGRRDTHLWVGSIVYTTWGWTAELSLEIERAIELNPTTTVHTKYCVVLDYNHQNDGMAIAHCRKALAFHFPGSQPKIVHQPASAQIHRKRSLWSR